MFLFENNLIISNNVSGDISLLVNVFNKLCLLANLLIHAVRNSLNDIIDHMYVINRSIV